MVYDRPLPVWALHECTDLVTTLLPFPRWPSLAVPVSSSIHTCCLGSGSNVLDFSFYLADQNPHNPEAFCYRKNYFRYFWPWDDFGLALPLFSVLLIYLLSSFHSPYEVPPFTYPCLFCVGTFIKSNADIDRPGSFTYASTVIPFTLYILPHA